MLNVAPLSGGPGYYLELTNISDYTEGAEPLPLWADAAAKEFGLSEIAEQKHVRRQCAGFDPETREKLDRNAGKEGRNPGHD